MCRKTSWHVRAWLPAIYPAPALGWEGTGLSGVQALGALRRYTKDNFRHMKHLQIYRIRYQLYLCKESFLNHHRSTPGSSPSLC